MALVESYKLQRITIGQAKYRSYVLAGPRRRSHATAPLTVRRTKTVQKGKIPIDTLHEERFRPGTIYSIEQRLDY